MCRLPTANERLTIKDNVNSERCNDAELKVEKTERKKKKRTGGKTAGWKTERESESIQRIVYIAVT